MLEAVRAGGVAQGVERVSPGTARTMSVAGVLAAVLVGIFIVRQYGPTRWETAWDLSCAGRPSQRVRSLSMHAGGWSYVDAQGRTVQTSEVCVAGAIQEMK